MACLDVAEHLRRGRKSCHRRRRRWITPTLTLAALVAALVPGSRATPSLRIDIAGDGPSVYVYPDSVIDNSPLIDCYMQSSENGLPPWQDEGRADFVQDMGELWMHRAMLKHPRRTLDPSRADLFYVPIYPVLAFKLLGSKGKCDGRTRKQWIGAAIDFLDRRSPYFKRLGGTDHLLVCAWWNCRHALNASERMILSRAMVGINEKLVRWINWGCGERLIAVPYTANSAITSANMVGGVSPQERDIPFFFAGTARGRPERKNLAVAQSEFPASRIELGLDGHFWTEDATVYSEHITRSKFCFCPRGDTGSSRRLFDAIAAGCIPVVTPVEARTVPFPRDVNISHFGVVAPRNAFSTEDTVRALVTDLQARSEEDLRDVRSSLDQAREALIYGTIANIAEDSGALWDGMITNHQVADNFLREALDMSRHGLGDGRWSCDRPAESARVADRVQGRFPPPSSSWPQWLRETETLQINSHKLVLCALPSTGSLQFRMLAKRMEGEPNWASTDNYNQLFDPEYSQLPLLEVNKHWRMTSIFQRLETGWVKIAMVRDPVTRLLSAYLDLRWRLLHDEQHRKREDFTSLRATMEGQNDTRKVTPGEGQALVDETGMLLTFRDFVKALDDYLPDMPPGFIPMSAMCGLRHASYDSIIVFEDVMQSSRAVFETLPGDVWNDYAASGWGPHANLSFMEYDFGAGGAGSRGRQDRARDLFDSCAWTEYYDRATLDEVGRIYQDDYHHFAWSMEERRTGDGCAVHGSGQCREISELLSKTDM